jgi:pimeloyl-ACP methyl ester carboxylesterase
VKESRSEFIELRGRRSHVRHWGPPDAPQLFMLHGWGDNSASYQFVVDALEQSWHVLALDWRGFGLSQWNNDHYWFPDYFADLDALVDHYSPDSAVDIVAHSMGGSVALIYSGVRPERVGRIVSLEGGSLLDTNVEKASGKIRTWLDQVGEAPPHFRSYPDRAAFAERLVKDNVRLTAEKATFLAAHLTVEREGRWEFAGDPCHRWANPTLFSVEAAKSIWRQTAAKVLWVEGGASFLNNYYLGREADYAERLACFQQLRKAVIPDAGHNLHHDQPERVAHLIEEFLREC